MLCNILLNKKHRILMTYLTAKNVLEKVKLVTVNLQIRDIDIVEAYKMIDYTDSDIKDLRKNVEREFHI